MINYDVMPNPPVGLKTLEGFLGSNIKETDVDFRINRKLTKEEIEMTVFYCRHDVEEPLLLSYHYTNALNVYHLCGEFMSFTTQFFKFTKAVKITDNRICNTYFQICRTPTP